MANARADQELPSADHPVSPDGPRRPALLIFDVNETLSDMSPMGQRFDDVGAPAHVARTWFAALLRDGFSLTAAGVNESFATIAAESLGVVLDGQPLD
ncbi:MAG TPA: haloacid dehalogenase type II, partial [Nocardioides sp.]